MIKFFFKTFFFRNKDVDLERAREGQGKGD